MPLGKDVGANIKELRRAKKKRSKKQIVAIALNAARESGMSIPMPKGMKKKMGKMMK